jgi:myosin heavy subunit
LSSDEAKQVLDQIISSTATENDRPQNIQRIEKDVEALQQTEKIFIEKLKAYEKMDREWNSLLSKQEFARNDLTRRKREEAEARKKLDEAVRMVSEAKANLVATSSALKNIEYVVRKNAFEMNQVTFTLTKKQERVRDSLRKKATMSNGGIQLDYLSDEDLVALRRKEMQLAGESEQLASMVVRLSARAEKLKARAAALDRYQQEYDEGSSFGADCEPPTDPTATGGPVES